MWQKRSIKVQEQVKARRIECNSTMFFKMRKITIIHQHDSMQCRCLYHTSICIFSMSQGRLMYLSRATLMHLITATSWAIMPSSYIGKMVTILWLQPQWAHRDKSPLCCKSTWKPMSESSSATKRYGSRYSDKLYPNTAVCFWIHIVGKHQI